MFSPRSLLRACLRKLREEERAHASRCAAEPLAGTASRTAYIVCAEGSTPLALASADAMGCSASCERALRAELAEEEALYARLARSLPAAPHGALHARS